MRPEVRRSSLLTRFVDRWQNLITSWFDHEREKAEMAGSVSRVKTPLAPGPAAARGHRSSTAASARSVARFIAIAAVIAGVAACGGSKPAAQPSTSPIATSPPTTPASSPSVRQTILAQYDAFWAQLTPASKAPASQRKQMLASYTVDPELSSLLRGMSDAESKDQVFYGRDKLRPRLSQLSEQQGVAVVDDCQDSRGSGLADRSTGRKLTAGVARNHVVSTLHRVRGRWLVAFVSYTKTSC